LPATAKDQAMGWNLTCAGLTWVLPGLGHFLLGYRTRGIVLAVSILGLWAGGLLVGGIGVIDNRPPDRDANAPRGVNLWYAGQVLVGPSIVVNYARGSILARQNPMPDDDPALEPSFGRVYEQGVLYTALAGLLNLLAMLDASFRQPGGEHMPRDPETASW